MPPVSPGTRKIRFSPTWSVCEAAPALMPRQLRIGIDARAAAEEPAGRGRYVRELLAHLPEGHDYRLYARSRWDGPARGSWRLIEARDPLWHLRAAVVASRECDVYLSTNSYLTAWATWIPTAIVVM